MSERSYRVIIKEVGARPPFGEVVDHVYGVNANVDTDGDSLAPYATNWTWLYMCQRPTENAPIVEATLLEDCNGLMIVVSDDMRLAHLAADFLAERSGGQVESYS